MGNEAVVIEIFCFVFVPTEIAANGLIGRMNEWPNSGGFPVPMNNNLFAHKVCGC